jgi:nicotinate-nucleotide adenylyltransferase
MTGQGLTFGAAARFVWSTFMKPMRVALYGGTFDPIHHGHLILAREAKERLALDRVVFIPAARSPFKPSVESTPGSSRLEMIRAAIKGEDGFEADGLELERGGTSYTIDTVLHAESRWPGAELYWFIGRDHMRELPRWRRFEELRERVRFVVFSRGASIDENERGPGFSHITRQVEISATDIRARVAHGDSIRYLVPEAVCELIQRHGLYRNPS